MRTRRNKTKIARLKTIQKKLERKTENYMKRYLFSSLLKERLSSVGVVLVSGAVVFVVEQLVRVGLHRVFELPESRD